MTSFPNEPAEIGVQLVPGATGKQGQDGSLAVQIAAAVGTQPAVTVAEHALPLHVEAAVARLGVVQFFIRAVKIVGG